LPSLGFWFPTAAWIGPPHYKAGGARGQFGIGKGKHGSHHWVTTAFPPLFAPEVITPKSMQVKFLGASE
jgi:hypothetical protein